MEAFSLRDSSRPAAFAFARILIFRGRYPVAARITLGNLERDENPAYVMWKWWNHSFEGRPRSAELGRGFMDAIFQEFERGDAPTRLLIARVFRKGEPESRLSTEEFKQAIGYRP